MKFKKLWGDITSTLWFRPMLWVLGLAGIALGFSYLDRIYELDEETDVLPWFLFMGVDAAGDMLTAIATATMTVTSLAFSLMMLAVVQTANAYSPRMLRDYLSDKFNQHVLGILLGTFVYSLLVLRGVSAYKADAFAPLLGTNGAFLLAIASTVALIGFIDNVSRSLKVGSVIKRILESASNIDDAPFYTEAGEAWRRDTVPDYPDSQPLSIPADDTGYVQLCDVETAYELAVEEDLLIDYEKTVGDHALKGARIARVWGEDIDDKLFEKIRGTLILGSERTFDQDLRYVVVQLSDIALRALSPGTNDPTTATDTMNSIGEVLIRVVSAGLGNPLRGDEDDNLRLVFPYIGFESLLDLAFGQILHYGGEDEVVVDAVEDLCLQLRQLTIDEAQRRALDGFLKSNGMRVPDD
ncbi:MAG: DUF2254 domain-containing protein [Myxococcota bacterium]